MISFIKDFLKLSKTAKKMKNFIYMLYFFNITYDKKR